MKKKVTKKKVDYQLKAFEKEDIGIAMKKNGIKGTMIYPPLRPTSILLKQDLIDKLKEKAHKKGLPYQTFLKMVLMENLDKY